MKTITYIIFLNFVFSVQASVWKTKNNWSEKFEAKYQQWVLDKWNDDIFVNNKSKYYDLPTDCADAVYAMRIIFSYENGLPFAASNRYSKSNKGPRLLSNKMRYWDKQKHLKRRFRGNKKEKLPKERHWRSLSTENKKVWLFIYYIGTLTGTSTIANDTIPVSLGRQGITPGTILLKKNEHVYTVKKIDEFGNIIKLSSTVPRAVRKLDYTDSFELFPETRFSSGILTFRYPEEVLQKNIWKIKRKSTEQYKLYDLIRAQYGETDKFYYKYEKAVKFGFENFPALAIKIETTEEIILRNYNMFCRYAQKRIKVVQEAIKYKNKLKRCMNNAEYENYSTPSRDHKLFRYAIVFVDKLSDLDNMNLFSKVKNLSFRIHLENIINDVEDDQTDIWMKKCRIHYDQNNQSKYITLPQLLNMSMSSELASDPNLNLKQRWGLEEFPQVSTCSSVYNE